MGRQGDGETRRLGDKERRRQERQGDKDTGETRRLCETKEAGIIAIHVLRNA
jgi:hypothetical protein